MAKASFWTQFKSLLVRNILLKWRNRRQTLQEFLLPICFVLFLALLKWITTPKARPAIERPPIYSLDNIAFSPHNLIYFSPDTQRVRGVAEKMANSIPSLEYKLFPSAEEAESAYLKNSSDNPHVMGIHFSGATLLNYTIRVPYKFIAHAGTEMASEGQCRSTEISASNCLVNSYLYSGFSQAQLFLDTLIMQETTGTYNDTHISKPKIYVQMFPKAEWRPDVSFIRYFAALYYVLAYSPFISFLCVNLVYEKEKKLKDAMRMMGMRDSAFWCSWGVVYTVMIAIVTGIVVLLAYISRFFEHSNMLLFYMMLFLYGLSIVNLSFAITPFFDRADTAGTLAGLATILLSLIYLVVYFIRIFLGQSAFPVWAFYLLCLLSPVALALSVDQAIVLDVLHGGMNFQTANLGSFPLSSMMIMLALDVVLYGLLAFYLDNIIPNEYGFRRKPYFFIQPSYWCPKDARIPEQFSLIGDEDTSHVADNPAIHDTENIESVPPELRNKNALRIFDIKKTYKTKGKETNAVDGISLDIYEGQITALLGHNGAGKTTLLHMLTGMTPPTSGTATIYGLDVSDMSELNVLRTMIGFCPQHNILFDDLTPSEHLRYYGAIKGVPEDKLNSEVMNALRQVDLYKQRDTYAKRLSGGEKRKACVAIALIGNPKLMFLDEPTAGMDPASRRHVWQLLQRQRDKLIVLSTHFMDEADILADRKAIISKGRLRCVGSSLFLKLRFGIGYHLSMVLEPTVDTDKIADFIKEHVADASSDRPHGREFVVTLPVSAVSSFPDLFGALEAKEGDRLKSEDLGIQSYAVSMTNLEEVFLKLGHEADAEGNGDELDAENITDSRSHLIDPTLMNYSTIIPMDGASRAQSSVPPENIALSEGKSLEKQRFLALFKLRALLLFRSIPRFVFQIIFPLLYVLVGVALLKITPRSQLPEPLSLRLQPSLYANNSLYTYYPNFLYKNSGSPRSLTMQFIEKLRGQDVQVQEYSDVSELLEIAPHYIGADIIDVSMNGKVLSSTLTALYNTSAVHSIPSIMNAFSTALLRIANPSSPPIVTYSQSWPPFEAIGINGGILGFAIFLGVALASIPPGFGINVVKDRVVKAKSQLRLSGVTSAMYWSSVLVFDSLQYATACLIVFIIILAFQIPAFITSGAITVTALIFVLYVPVNMLLSYVLSFMFNKFETAQSILPNLFVWGAVLPLLVVIILDFAQLPHPSTIAHYIFSILTPVYPMVGGLYFINKIYTSALDPSMIHFGEYFAWSNHIPITIIMPIGHSFLLFFLLRVLDVHSDGGNWRDALKFSDSGSVKHVVPEQNNDIPEDEDEDVTAERTRVQQATTSSETEAVKIKNLRKEFPKSGKTLPCLSAKPGQIHVAVRNSSLMVETGEVVGLLGPNGAGKSTTLNMIIADTPPTRGEIYVAGHDIQSNLSKAYQAMGYCPQQDALWDKISLKEHLECYASVRGIPPDQVSSVIEYYMESLRIKEHAEKKANDLSGGTKRKLSYIISILGKPKVVLLDEPSTGMDPKSKRFLWDTISETFDGTGRGALLTTHYMDEADALCARVAIMVNGGIECIGTTQRLKQKYGGGFQLEVKITTSMTEEEAENKMVALKEYIEGVFGGVEQRENFGDRALFHVPSAAVHSLSQTFSALEKGKSLAAIEDYSFSQATLEQVFLEFAKLQVTEEGEDDSQRRQHLRHRRELNYQVQQTSVPV